MMFPTSALLFGTLLPLAALAAPNPAPASASAASSLCSKNAVYLQIAAPTIASTASVFSSSYIRPTATATKIVIA